VWLAVAAATVAVAKETTASEDGAGVANDRTGDNDTGGLGPGPGPG
jgi:hypothetical protein